MDFVNENEVGFSRKVKEVIFGSWKLSLKYQTISDGETQRELEPLLFSLLTYFIKHNDRIIPRQEFVDEVWKQVYVDDNAINRAMSELRKVLKSDKQRGQVIKTHYRKGYSFTLDVDFVYHEIKNPIADVTEVDLPAKRKLNTVVDSVAFFRNYKLIFVSLIFAFTLFAVLFNYYAPSSSAKDKMSTLAVSDTLLSWKKGTSLTPLLSKDASFLAYSFRESSAKGFNLHIKEMNTLKEFKVAEHDADIFPVGWSANRELFYQISQLGNVPKCEIWKVSLTKLIINAKHKKLFDCQSNQIISLDAADNGQTLLYTKYNYRGRKDLSAIVSRDLNTKSEFQVTSPNITEFGDYYIKISNQGERIAFLRANGTSTKIFVANIDGSNQSELLEEKYYINSISWDDADMSISWINMEQEELNTYDFASGAISKYKIKSDYEFNNAFGLQLVSKNRAIVATDYLNTNILKLNPNRNDSNWLSEFSNTDMHETLVTPFPSKDEAIYLVGKKNNSIWRYAEGRRKKLLDLNFTDILSLQVSPSEEEFLIARNNKIQLYSLADLTLLSEFEFENVIRSVSWPLASKLLLTYDNGKAVNIGFYDLDNKRLIKLSNENIKSALMIDTNKILYMDGREHLRMLDVVSGETREITFDTSLSGISVWTADNENIYYSDDGRSIYQSSLSGGRSEKLVELQGKTVFDLSIASHNKNAELYLTVFEVKDNLLLDMQF